ncbi:MAG: hypothetical protein K9H14_07460 [Actinomycetia bacterium]|nr:hypothetical protein [Actinomycetes bacterium]
MFAELSKKKISWILLSALALIASATGVFYFDVYRGLVSESMAPGIFAQDLMTLLASAVMLILAIFSRPKQYKIQIIILGVAGYLFYAYGIYVIERIYNVMYLGYMAIFALAFFTLVYGVASIDSRIKAQARIPGSSRVLSIIFLLLQPVVFYPLWASQLLSLMIAREKIEFLYSVYILDFCFIMPVFIIIAVSTIRKEGLGFLMAPSMFVLGFTLLFPLGVAELMKPFYNQPIDAGSLVLFLVFSLIFLAIAILYLKNLSLEDT